MTIVLTRLALPTLCTGACFALCTFETASTGIASLSLPTLLLLGEAVDDDDEVLRTVDFVGVTLRARSPPEDVLPGLDVELMVRARSS